MHFYLFNIGDYQTHTNHLSEMEDLAYRRLLDWYYLHEKPLPLDVDDIAKRIRMRTHTDCIAMVLQEFFERTAEGFINHRADLVIAAARAKSESASKSANARWNKKSSKNNKLENDANALQTQSEGNAIQESIINNQNQGKSRAVALSCPQDVNPQVWADWLHLRRSKKAAVTETVLNGARSEAVKAGMPLQAFLEIWCLRGSQGLQADWIKPDERNQALSRAGQTNQSVMSGLTRGLIGGTGNVKLLGK